jgi:hypothetical protein
MDGTAAAARLLRLQPIELARNDLARIAVIGYELRKPAGLAAGDPTLVAVNRLQ